LGKANKTQFFLKKFWGILPGIIGLGLPLLGRLELHFFGLLIGEAFRKVKFIGSGGRING